MSKISDHYINLVYLCLTNPKLYDELCLIILNESHILTERLVKRIIYQKRSRIWNYRSDLCKHVSNDNHDEKKCLYAHSLIELRCPYYIRRCECLYGDNCLFQHY